MKLSNEIRILYEEGQASLNKTLKNWENYRKDILLAFKIRKIEEKFLDLFSMGKLSGTVHTCIGQEFTGVAISKYLEKNDWVTSNHRCHGHFIAKTNKWENLIDELLGLETGVSKGIGSSQHLYTSGFISNGTQGSLLPVATGMAKHLKSEDSKNIVVSFIGEGTFGEGITYEALNMSSALKVPHLIICENNFYSQSTYQEDVISGSIEMRAQAFGIKVFSTSTWDLFDLFETCKKAIAYTRKNNKPAFVNIKTYRLKAHSKGDDDRDIEELKIFNEIDLINKLIVKNSLKSSFEEIEKEVNDYVNKKIDNTNFYSKDKYFVDQLPRKTSLLTSKVKNEKILLSKALNKSYQKKLIEGAIFIGEDIKDPYGGAFKITKNFSNIKKENIISTSISEGAIVGISIGLSLFKKKVFAEIMFGDFIVNAMDQIINNASKFYHMYGQQIDCSIIIRTPMGAGRGYGPTHSQNLEKIILGIENIAVFYVNSLINPVNLINDVSKLNCTSVVLENKLDYANYLWQGHKYLETYLIGASFGTINIRPISKQIDLIVVTYGRLARLIADNYEDIFNKTDSVFDLFCFQQLHPFPYNHIKNRLNKTNKILIIDESSSNFGWSDGVNSILSQNFKDLKISSLSAYPYPIPSQKKLEDELLINIKKICDNITQLIND